jgi:tRNA (cmo5U34)-methyltransferase
MTPTNPTSIGHTPEGKWAFDDDVTNVFDDMLRRSIPQYDVMRDTVFHLGSRFVTPTTSVIDIGCSRGDAIAPFVDKFGAYNHYVGVEVSKPMLEACRARFDGFIKCGVVNILDMDLRKLYPPERPSLTLAVLTLQFIPIEYRQHILERAWFHTVPGGALILVEKVLGETSTIDRHFTEVYTDHKLAAGYSQDEIARKALSLEGVLVPITAKANRDLLKGAGFARVDCFWRWCNFAGWLAIK